MKSEEILRLVDTIHRSKEIEKEVVFQGIEAALLSAVRRKHGESEEDNVIIDRETGVTTVIQDGQEIDPEELGRLAAMSGKQVMFQKIREAERDRIFEEYEDKIGQLVSGVVQRYEGPNLIVSLGRVEGFLPRSEQAPGERFRVGERIKSLVKDLQKSANRVKITLSRTDRELVKALFALEIPEVQDNVIEIKEIAREAGYRTKIAVTTYDSRVQAVVQELRGEKIDIVRWNESDEVLIIQALKPAEISTMELDDDTRKATIYVKPDQQSLAIGKRGQNVRLASKLTGWELEIEPITDEELEQMRKGGAGEVEVDIEAEEAAPEDTGEEAELTEETLLAQEADEETAEDSPEADGEGSEAEEETEDAEAEAEAPVEETEEAEAETEAPAEEAEEAEAETEAPAEEAEEAEAETEAPAEEAEEAEAETEAPAEEAEEAEAETEAPAEEATEEAKSEE